MSRSPRLFQTRGDRLPVQAGIDEQHRIAGKAALDLDEIALQQSAGVTGCGGDIDGRSGRRGPAVRREPGQEMVDRPFQAGDRHGRIRAEPALLQMRNGVDPTQDAARLAETCLPVDVVALARSAAKEQHMVERRAGERLVRRRLPAMAVVAEVAGIGGRHEPLGPDGRDHRHAAGLDQAVDGSGLPEGAQDAGPARAAAPSPAPTPAPAGRATALRRPKAVRPPPQAARHRPPRRGLRARPRPGYLSAGPDAPAGGPKGARGTLPMSRRSRRDPTIGRKTPGLRDRRPDPGSRVRRYSGNAARRPAMPARCR